MSEKTNFLRACDVLTPALPKGSAPLKDSDIHFANGRGDAPVFLLIFRLLIRFFFVSLVASWLSSALALEIGDEWGEDKPRVLGTFGGTWRNAYSNRARSRR